MLGTAIGCGLMLALSLIPSQTLWIVVLQIAVGIAHAFVTRRYLVTTIAATIVTAAARCIPDAHRC